MENSILLLVIQLCSKVELCSMNQEAPNMEAVGRKETLSSCMVPMPV